MFTKIEFAVQMTCESCVKEVKRALNGVPDIANVEVNLEQNRVVVETALSTEDVLKRLQSTGRKAVVKGIEGTLAAVAVLDLTKEIQGVVRFTQVDLDTCIIDGTIDGLKPGKHGLYIHESGDLSEGCNSVGDCFNPRSYDSISSNRAYGDLGFITTESNGRTTFRIQDKVIKLSDVIGRSFVITQRSDGGPDSSEKRVTCGIIARSSGLFQNPKTICACDGVSIWDEKEQPKSSL